MFPEYHLFEPEVEIFILDFLLELGYQCFVLPLTKMQSHRYVLVEHFGEVPLLSMSLPFQLALSQNPHKMHQQRASRVFCYSFDSSLLEIKVLEVATERNPFSQHIAWRNELDGMFRIERRLGRYVIELVEPCHHVHRIVRS